MLVEFSVKNYRSIKNNLLLSLAKSKGNELASSNSFSPSAPASVPLLRSAAIYGANAAGKSNIIRAMEDMVTIVCTSASRRQSGEQMPLKPFLFDEQTATEPTEFEMVFINDGIRYQYGFSATESMVLEEWLYAFPKGRPQNWFSRVVDSKTAESDYKFGDSLTGQKTVWQKATRKNALFLSTAILLNSEQLKPVFDWFDQKLKISSTSGFGDSFTTSLCDEEKQRQNIVTFLQAADIDIQDVQLDKEKFDPKTLPSDMPSQLKEIMHKELQDREMVYVKFLHKTEHGRLVPLDLEDESEGTQKLYSIAGPVINVLKKGRILVVDELHNHLHPKLVSFLLGLFHNDKTNPHNAQLIFTTHETSILNQDMFRRDQIWFCEKTAELATILYPLTDFSPRKGRENIELGYLSGRYGATPIVNSFELSEE